MTFRDSLYDRYVSTHVAHRSGTQDAASLRSRARVFRQHFGRYLPSDRGARIADLGCGWGALVWWLSQSGYREVYGIDASAEQVELARTLGIPHVQRGDVFEFLEAQRDFDLLFARDLLEHFDKQAAFDFLRRSHAALRAGGTLVLQVPNAESPYFGRVRYGDFTHEVAYTSSSLLQVLGAAGFERIAVRPWRPAVTGVRSALRYCAWRVIEPLLKLPIAIESGGQHIVTMNLVAVARRAG